MAKVCFNDMSDDRVLERVEVLVRRSNETTAELLAYLAEVDERKLYRREATSSLFAFCVERLHMSESAAAKRIWAARAGRRFPLVLEMVARGEIHLTGVSLLAAHLTQENHAELLARARHKTRRAIEKLVAELTPRPDAPSRVVALPRGLLEEPALVVIQPAGSSQDGLMPAAAAIAPPRPSIIVTLAPRRYEIRVTVDEETHAKLMQLQDLLAPSGASDPAVIFTRAIDDLHQKTLARKAAITERPRASRAPQKHSRPVPAAVKRSVWKRDEGRCAFVDDKGRRCSATRFLEFHHLDNWARGAKHSVERIELRCRAHNQYQAELDYGAEFMRARRQGASPAREPSRPYGADKEHSPGNAMWPIREALTTALSLPRRTTRGEPRHRGPQHMGSRAQHPPAVMARRRPQISAAHGRELARLRLACASHGIGDDAPDENPPCHSVPPHRGQQLR